MLAQMYQSRAIASARVDGHGNPGVSQTVRRGWSMAIGMIVIALDLLLLVSYVQLSTAISARASAPSAFDARLRALSVNPVIQRAAQHRLALASRDPEALAVAVTATAEAPRSVRGVLAGEVNEVVIVDWLVSFGAKGAWTAYNPRNTETVNIPVSDIPELAARSPGKLGIYWLRDHRHLMLVRPVVVGDQAVGAVGFVLTQTYEDPVLAAAAGQLD